MNLTPAESNPYAASSGMLGNVGQPAKPGLPLFAMIMFITSLFFSLLRVLLVMLGFAGYVAMKNMDPPPPELASVPAEIGTGIAIAFFGIFGNGLLLAKQKLGLFLGYLLVLAVIGSILTGFWQASGIMSKYDPGSPEFIGAIVGLVFVVGIRIAILAAYVAALIQFKKWHDKRALAMQPANFGPHGF